ncbi:hypothetical protein J7443_00605 [Tropicibacter sp. R15_0]|uniref:hypothetical protein n=1 Tax=Tropicibacter sp. R15_0 TaxID=2821101 RepID=UPI001ADCABA4|nr:hypothetical protein [Tropicibacter sp. R15_0]MBO9463714.1 hypothetical protein [Tropicibacter sp. R15_0]
MAIVAILLGSLFGLVAGITGFAFGALTPSQAFMVYLFCGAAMGMVQLLSSVIACKFGRLTNQA